MKLYPVATAFIYLLLLKEYIVFMESGNNTLDIFSLGHFPHKYHTYPTLQALSPSIFLPLHFS